MIQNAKQMSNTMLLSLGQGRLTRNIWQQRSASGEAIWSWITWAFTAYWMLFVAGAFLGHKQLNAVGGVVVLGVLALVLLERLWVRMDAVVMASLAAATCLPLLQLLFTSAPDPESLFKHISLCLVIAVARLLHLPAAFKSKMRWPLAAQVLVILLISLTIYKGTSWDGGTRHSGLFVNPNNLALIPFLLLFFINPVKDKWFFRVVAHGIVAAVLAFSGTSGAVLAYLIGLLVHLSGVVSKRVRSVVFSLAAVAGLAAVVFLSVGGLRLLPETRLINQISVIGSQLQNVINGSNIAYYTQERVLGSGSASGIWRVAHWRETVALYLDGTSAQQIFGFGIGGAVRIMGILPHNEYLRMLFEQGIIGLLLFLFAWYRMIRTAPVEVRYIGLIVAIYSFSENNLDNFPFMSLFILCLSARGVGETVKATTKPAIAIVRNRFALMA
jgi:O-Antigen ligase